MSVLKVEFIFLQKSWNKIKTFLHKYWTSGVNRDDHCLPENDFSQYL